MSGGQIDGGDDEKTQVIDGNGEVNTQVVERKEVMSFTSVEEANDYNLLYNSFPLALPSVLPENAELNRIDVDPPGGEFTAHGASVLYNLIVDDEAWNQADSPYIAYIMLGQYDYGIPGAGLMEFERAYNSGPWSSEISPGEIYEYETVQIMLGDTKAVLYSQYMPVLLGQKEPSDVVGAGIVWYKDGINYFLSVFAPGDMVDYESLISIAESVG